METLGQPVFGNKIFRTDCAGRACVPWTSSRPGCTSCAWSSLPTTHNAGKCAQMSSRGCGASKCSGRWEFLGGPWRTKEFVLVAAVAQVVCNTKQSKFAYCGIR